MENHDKSELIDGLVGILEKRNLTKEQIAELIKNVYEPYRKEMCLTVLNNGNKELANKIEWANNIIAQNQIKSFYQLIQSGKQEEYLSKMKWTDKHDLIGHIEIQATLLGRTLSDEEKLMVSILKDSLANDKDNVGNARTILEQNFNNVSSASERRHL